MEHGAVRDGPETGLRQRMRFPHTGGFAAAKPAGHGRSAVMAANQTKTVANGDASMLGTFGFGPSPGLH